MKNIHFLTITVVFTVILLSAVLFGRRSSGGGSGSFGGADSGGGAVDLLQQTILLQSSSFNRLQIHGADTVSDVNGNRLSLSEIFCEPRLVLRFMETNCDACIEAELRALRRFERLIGSANIVVLASYARARDFRIMCQTYDINFPAYNISSDAIASPLERANRPYLFVMDSTFVAGFLFVPNKELPRVSEAYYQSIAGLWNVQMNNSTASTARANVPHTTLRIENSTHRFGSLRSGDDATATFTILNTGNAPLLLHEVQTTCGCTAPEWSRQPVQPGQTATVKVKYDTNISGVFSKRAFIFSNADGSPHGVTISGEVVVSR